MKEQIKRLWPVVGLPLLIVVIALAASSRGVDSPLDDMDAPQFEAAIEAGDGAAQGDRIALSGLRGRVVLLDFWASWCPPCRESIPLLNRVASRYESRPVTVLGVNVEPNLNNAMLQSAHRAFESRFPSIQDKDGSLQVAYFVESLPTLIVISPQGKVAHVEVGVPDPERLERTIDSLLEGLDD